MSSLKNKKILPKYNDLNFNSLLVNRQRLSILVNYKEVGERKKTENIHFSVIARGPLSFLQKDQRNVGPRPFNKCLGDPLCLQGEPADLCDKPAGGDVPRGGEGQVQEVPGG